ncbi:MAG: hypothetical protein G8345_02975 [Magnetococcales bacterium]|nr:flagellar hook-length control protein FliK [Magnetococcales bacterium]NGZ25836.1 hypothetical protein [Magnetococcales bacterium]
MSPSPAANLLIGGAITNSFAMPVFTMQGGSANQQDFQHLLDVALQHNPAMEEQPVEDSSSSQEDMVAQKPDPATEKSAAESKEETPPEQVEMVTAMATLLQMTAAATAAASAPDQEGVEQQVALLTTGVSPLTPAVVSQALAAGKQAVEDTSQLPSQLPTGENGVAATENTLVANASAATDPLAETITEQAMQNANIVTLTPVEQLQQQTMPWRPITMGDAVKPEVESERVVVTLQSESSPHTARPLPSHLQGQSNEQENGQPPPPPPDAPQVVAAEVDPLAEFSFSTVTNGFTNGFTNNAGILPAAGVSLQGQGGVSGATNPVGTNLARPLTSTVTDFPDVVAGELGRTRIVTRPNQSEQIRIQLDPQDLGELDMRVKVDADRQVHMLITTESEQTKDLLQKQLGQLRDALAGQNLSMGDVRVEVDARGHSGEAWRNARQSPSWQSSGSGKAAGSEDESPAATPPPPRRLSMWLPSGGISVHA